MRDVAGKAAERGRSDARRLAAHVPAITELIWGPEDPPGSTRHARIQFFRCPFLLRREEVSSEKVSAEQLEAEGRRPRPTLPGN
jgi:hypothetical protein